MPLNAQACNATFSARLDTKYISTLDIQKGFLNIPLEKKRREKTAFSVPGRGLFHLKRMPFV